VLNLSFLAAGGGGCFGAAMATTITLKSTAVRITQTGVSDRVIHAPSYLYNADAGLHVFTGALMTGSVAHAEVDSCSVDDSPVSFSTGQELADAIAACLNA